MKPTSANLNLILAGFGVQRWHTNEYVIKRETVGHHTARALALLFYLYDDNPSIKAVKCVLHHDVTEYFTGDTPAQAKWEWPSLKINLERIEDEVARLNNLSDWALEQGEYWAVKFVDVTDAALKALDEMVAGNVHFAVILARLLAAQDQLLKKCNKFDWYDRGMDLKMIIYDNPHINIEEVRQDYAKTHPEEAARHTKARS